MEHHEQYTLGRYRVVEQIEKVTNSYRWRVTAYDDQTARNMPWNPTEVKRFEAERVAPTLADARRELQNAAGMMRDDIAREAP